MKYAAVILSTLAATTFAIPQAASTVTAAPSLASANLTPQQSCAIDCPAGDVNCQAQCVGAAHPNSSQASETTECAARCDQGDGSPAATERYSQCVQACITSHFPTSQTVGAPAAGSNAPASGASNVASATGAAASSGASRAASGTGAESTASGSASGAAASSSSTGAASANNVQLAGAGLAGLFMAVFAL